MVRHAKVVLRACMFFALIRFIFPALAAAIAIFGGVVLTYHLAPQTTLFASNLLQKHTVLVAVVFAHAVIVIDFYSRLFMHNVRMNFVGAKSRAQHYLNK